MSKWFDRLFAREKSVAEVVAPAPVAVFDPQAESVAQRKSGNQFLDQGDLRKAADCYRKAVGFDPNSSDAHTSLGFALKELNELSAAEVALATAVQLKPDSFDAVYLLGQTCYGLGQFERAAQYFEKALALRPDFEALYGELSQALFEVRALARAREVITAGIQRFPENPMFHFHLGNLCSFMEQWPQASNCYQAALKLKLNSILLQNNLGQALKHQGRFLEAEACYRAALLDEPDSDVYLTNLGGILVTQGRLFEAIRWFRRAIEVNPGSMAAHGNLLYSLSVGPETSNEEYRSAALAFGDSLARHVATPFRDWLVSRDDRADSKLRVGLVSGQLRNSPVGFFLEGVLANIDPTKLELVAYATSGKEDELTARIRPHFAQWENILGMKPTWVAEKIRADRIDILVDLNGHTDGNLLEVFAWKPAPVQVSWLGYWASTGIVGIDYILADPASLPPCDQRYFTETVHYLPTTRLCFTPPRADLAVSPLPALRNGFVTFGCFQSRTKLTETVLALWGQILKRIPDARLRLASHQIDDAASTQEFLARLQCAGIDSARVSVVGPVPRDEYLSSYALVDIVLDTFPFTGGTTTCEAFWMGVPTLTLGGGNTMIARQGAVMLALVGLDAWVASDADDYVAKAVSRAADIEGLTVLRKTLRARAMASALFDAPRFARNLEDAFRAMWLHKLDFATKPPHEAACRDAVQS